MQILHTFLKYDGDRPVSGVVQASDGTLYGTTYYGGAHGTGTIFCMDANGDNFRVLHSFRHDTGFHPYAGVIIGADGNLYGTTRGGGASNRGTIFAFNLRDMCYTVLRSLNRKREGEAPFAELMQGKDGYLYGTARFGGTHDKGVIFKMTPDGSDFKKLHTFCGNPTDGEEPSCALLQGKDGYLYGTTEYGGTKNKGTIFRIKPNGKEYQILYAFRGFPNDAAFPLAGLIQSDDGALYGTAARGTPYDAGAVFKIYPDGTGYQILHAFRGRDGVYPVSSLIFGKDGFLYGTAHEGGCHGMGVVFRLNADGSGFKLLHSFAGNPDGECPLSSLYQAADGALYGTTREGGVSERGTVFKIMP